MKLHTLHISISKMYDVFGPAVHPADKQVVHYSHGKSGLTQTLCVSCGEVFRCTSPRE